ncbi:integrase arm-type DNA-binding domain-containing protein [Xenorhabdus bovienii]|uniref:tyrosine-type recombinase/integrase n=1 Tax=Xenorhabdus bovienii TaxID=40576 RepID=UPI00237C7483|nr:site-specific integrase [Xenorhabdus bovienii]MDE1482182.1 integrase arm-type DNA-binding domain-containing protein [Xenorhabdus bovienii]MDE9465106.1 integrase arm-type DNA-binding domain-containing protein [Xenorhabdus bovienii]MDE9468812.1 integrase arm-type DNA-binding domain-containing protein [Xenorhabdus bovienii]MDE9547593.1 integrase arm-type DNA-binding domain-containing protein [Xenorhabdus bovienii]MDE9557424.1 integrase arm-type DNA-binding domain-containing protein [Xenorhabdu
MATNLTETGIRGLKPKSSAYYEWSNSGQRGAGRLGVKVQPSGSKIFYFRYYVEKGTKERFIKIGIWPEMKLVIANELAKKYGAWLIEGKDPQQELEQQNLALEQEKQRYQSQGSFEDLIKGYVNKMKADGKRTWLDVQKRLEKECYVYIPRHTKAKEVTPLQIKQTLAGIIQRDAIVHSNRIRSYLMAAFNYGLKADNDPMNSSIGITFGLEVNPVTAIPKQASAEKVGDNWLTLEELRFVMEQFSLATNVGPLMQHLIRVCVYAGGQRPYEIIASQWSAIDWQQRTLLVVADVSKNKREHLIPLTESILRELNAVKGLMRDNESPYIFPLTTDAKRPIRTDSLARSIMYFRASNPDFKVFTARDLRRTCKTLMGEAGISKEIRDRIQNHALNDVSSKHYDRYDYLNEKRHALEIWENRINNHQHMEQQNVVNMFG